MAREMDVATSTLRSYIKNILAKLGVHSRLQAAAIASREPGLSVGSAGFPVTGPGDVLADAPVGAVPAPRGLSPQR